MNPDLEVEELTPPQVHPSYAEPYKEPTRVGTRSNNYRFRHHQAKVMEQTVPMTGQPCPHGMEHGAQHTQVLGYVWFT